MLKPDVSTRRPVPIIRDRYAAVDLFALIPEWQLQFEPELAELDRLLSDDALFQQVKADLGRRYPHSSQTGRPSTPVEVVLRLLVVKHLYGWSYTQTEQFVHDSVVLPVAIIEEQLVEELTAVIRIEPQ